MDVGAAATAVGATGGLIFGVFGTVIGLQNRNASRRQAEETARQSDEMVKANVLTKHANELAKKAYDLAAERSALKVHWSLVHNGGDTYALVNDGDAVAYNVSVSHERLVANHGTPVRERVAPGETLDPSSAVVGPV